MRPHETVSAEVHSANLVIVTLRGEHDLASAPEVRTALATGSGRRDVIVDLSHCSFIDSSVISALLRASNALHAQGGQLALVIPGDGHDAIRRLFELMSIDRLMPTFETRAAAISHTSMARGRQATRRRRLDCALSAKSSTWVSARPTTSSEPCSEPGLVARLRAA